jgi:hypothetical protein
MSVKGIVFASKDRSHLFSVCNYRNRMPQITLTLRDGKWRNWQTKTVYLNPLGVRDYPKWQLQVIHKRLSINSVCFEVGRSVQALLAPFEQFRLHALPLTSTLPQFSLLAPFRLASTFPRPLDAAVLRPHVSNLKFVGALPHYESFRFPFTLGWVICFRSSFAWGPLPRISVFAWESHGCSVDSLGIAPLPRGYCSFEFFPLPPLREQLPHAYAQPPSCAVWSPWFRALVSEFPQFS